MKLISCRVCGVLLDQDKLKFAEDMYSDFGDVDPTKAAYDQERKTFYPYVPCPCCSSQVFKDQK